LDAIDWLCEGERRTEIRAPLNRLDIGTLNEVMVVFTRLIKAVEHKFVSYLNICSISHQLIVNLGSLHLKNHAETGINAASEHFSQQRI
jgi:hypothetical protein